MNKMQKTAKTLDKIFHALQIAITVAAVTLLVGLVIILAAFIFDLKPEQVGTDWEKFEVGFLTLTLAQAPDYKTRLLFFAITFVTGFGMMLVGRECFKSVRTILKPVMEGTPFSEATCNGLEKLACLTIILGVLVNLTELVMQILLYFQFDLPSLLLSDKITHVSADFTLDLSFLIFGGILLLLARVFQYGAQLQEQVDETL